MRTLREIWDDPKTWRWSVGDSSAYGAIGCIVAEVVFWGLAWLLYRAFAR